MSEKITCDRCKKVWNEKEWKGNIHEIIDEFNGKYRFDICYDCEQILTVSFLNKVASFLVLSRDIVVWRIVQQ